jgi:hypothetical protein
MVYFIRPALGIAVIGGVIAYDFIREGADVYKVPVAISLGVIAVVLGVSIAASWFRPAPPRSETE